MSPDINAINADYEAWQTAHQSFDTDQWHLTADRLAGWVPDLLAALADPRRDPMYHDRYFAVDKVLSEALGPNEEDGTGEGIAADVALLAKQRDEARAELARYAERLDLDAWDRLEARLAAAETVCTMYGWTGARFETEREKAALQAWMDWSHAYGTPKPSPEWDARIADLAARRDAIRERTLAAIRGEPAVQVRVDGYDSSRETGQ